MKGQLAESQAAFAAVVPKWRTRMDLGSGASHHTAFGRSRFLKCDKFQDQRQVILGNVRKIRVNKNGQMENICRSYKIWNWQLLKSITRAQFQMQLALSSGDNGKRFPTS